MNTKATAQLLWLLWEAMKEISDNVCPMMIEMNNDHNYSQYFSKQSTVRVQTHMKN